MNLKRITSLTMLTSIIMMAYTGIMLFICPPGRVANWANWELWGLNKEEYAAVHSTFMVLFLIATVLHIYYNWKPMTSYMKNRARQMIVFTNDMIVAVALTIVIFVGTIHEVSPFSNFLEFGTDVSDSWIEEYGEPPYGHAELSSLKLFTKKMGLDLSTSEQALKAKEITYESAEMNLHDIAKANDTSPQALYEIMQAATGKSQEALKESAANIDGDKYTGLGRRKISDVAKVVGLDTASFLSKLQSIGISAKEDERFKDVCERANMSPSDVIEQLGL